MTDAPKTASPATALEARYREAVRERLEPLRLQGLTQTGEALRPRLEEVYVELQVVAEVPEARDDYSAAERRLLHERERQGPDEQEQERELDSLRYRRWKQEARRERTRLPPQSLEATLDASPAPALVLLGDPGSGKSTLLRFASARLRTGPPNGSYIGGALRFGLGNVIHVCCGSLARSAQWQ